MTAEQTKITKEKKMSMMQELDGKIIAQPRKPKGGFCLPKSQGILGEKASDAEFKRYHGSQIRPKWTRCGKRKLGKLR